MRRAAPEERDTGAGPLFEAQQRGELGARRAADRADRVEVGWRASALEQVRTFASTHATFTAEEIGLVVPKDADPRATGHVMQEAKRNGWIEVAGSAPTKSSNGSFKVLWKSRIVEVPR